MADKAKSIRKAEIISTWKALEPAADLKPSSIVYKHEGTTIAEDGIRLTGSKDFIFSVLSRLKDLIKHENGATRLGLAFSEIVDKETGQIIQNAYRFSFHVHERGPEAQIVNRIIKMRTGQEAL